MGLSAAITSAAGSGGWTEYAIRTRRQTMRGLLSCQLQIQSCPRFVIDVRQIVAEAPLGVHMRLAAVCADVSAASPKPDVTARV